MAALADTIKPGLSHGLDFVPRRMLPRTKEADYFSLEGLQRLTATIPANLDKLILKELVDNALDICDETDNLRTPTVSVDVKKSNDSTMMLQVDDNGSGMDEEKINNIRDFKRFYSSRFHYKYASRGALGNAWKAIIGANFALFHAKQTEQIPIFILSGNTRYEIHGEYVNGEVVVPPPVQQEIKKRIGTTVIVFLPIYGEKWGDPERYRHDIESFACFNPQARITFQGAIVADSHVSRTKTKELRESPHHFSENEYVERYETQVRDHVERGEHFKLDSFIRQFWGASRDEQVKEILKRASMENCLEEQLLGKPELIIRLHRAMKEVCNAPSPNILGKIGRTNLGYRIEEIDGLLNSAKSFVYKCYKNTSILRQGESEVQIPYVLEVAVGVTGIPGRRIHVGLNRSIKMEDPFGRLVFFQERNRDWPGVKGVCEKNGIGRDQPVTVLVHITCPNIPYKDPGKTEINTDVFNIGDTIDRATKFYKRAKKRFELLRNSTGEIEVPEGQMEAVYEIIEEAKKHETSDGQYPYFEQRMLFYTVCNLLEKKGLSAFAPEYKYFPLILDECKKRGVDLNGLLLQANSILCEPRNDNIVYLSTEGEASYEIPKWLYGQVWVFEKKGLQRVVRADRLQDKLDALTVGGQGQSTFSVRRLLHRIEQTAKEWNEQIPIYAVHDGDVFGTSIYLGLSRESKRMKDNRIQVVDLGLSILEGMELGFKPEKVVLKKPKRIPKNVLEYLSQEELFALTHLKGDDLLKPIEVHYRIELNAFTPEEFLNWITKKIEAQGTKRKVRPPDDVLNVETQQRIDGALDQYIKDLMFTMFGGQKAVDQWKTLIVKQKSLDTLDLRQPLDETLKTFPFDGWREIIQQQVSSYVETTFKDPKARDEAAEYILNRLAGTKPEKLHRVAMPKNCKKPNFVGASSVEQDEKLRSD